MDAALSSPGRRLCNAPSLISTAFMKRNQHNLRSSGGLGPTISDLPRTLLPYPLGWRADRPRVIKPRARALKRAIAGLSSLTGTGFVKIALRSKIRCKILMGFHARLDAVA